jgi:iron complex outermembrane receptor protein
MAKLCLSCVGLFLFLFLTNSFAQEQKPIELGEIVVTATRISQTITDVPASVSVITKQEIKNTPSKTVDDLLKREAGIDVVRPYGESSKSQSISLRGIYGARSSRVLILLDGIPLNNLYNGSVDLNTIPTDAIERIEVVKGASSHLFGSNALGGVINIITKKPSKKFEIKLNGGGGNLGSWKSNLEISGTVGNLSYFLSGEKFHTQGYKNVPEEFQKSYYTYTDREMDKNSLSTKLVYKLTSESNLYTRFLRYYDKTNFGRKNYFGRTDENRFCIGYKAKKLQFNLFIDDLDDSYTSTKSGDVISYESFGDKDFWGLNFQNNFDLLSFWNLTWGIDFKQGKIKSNDEYKTTIRERYTKGRQRYLGIFLQNRFETNEKFSIYLGGRFDWWRSYDGENYDSKYNLAPLHYDENIDYAFSPKLGLVYHIKDDLIFRTSIAKAFRAPSLYELYRTWYWGTKTYASNPDLEPEEVWSFDLGIEKFLARARIGLTFYYNDINDLIYSVKVSPDYYQRKNVAEAVSRGIELETSYDLNEFFSFFFNYTYNHSQIKKCPEKKELEDKWLMHSPFNKASWGIIYKKEPLNLGLSATYVGERFDDDENKEKLKSYLLLDLKVSLHVKNNIEFFVDIYNLTNKTYSESYKTIAPPRTFMMGLNIKF